MLKGIINLKAGDKKLVNYSREFFSRYKFYLSSLIIIAWFAGVLLVSVNYKIKEIIDAIALQKGKGTAWLLAWFAGYKLMSHFMFWFMQVLSARYDPKILKQTIIDMYNMTVSHSLHWFDSHLSGTIVNKIADCQQAILALIRDSFYAIKGFTVIGISILYLWLINAKSAGILMLFIAVYSPVIIFLCKRQMKLEALCTQSRQDAVGVINDSITNIFGIKTIGNIRSEMNLKLQPAIASWQQWEQKRLNFIAYFVDNADTIMVTLMSVGQVYYLAFLYQEGEITSGDFAFVAMVSLGLHMELMNLLNGFLFSIIPSIAQIRSSFNYIADVVDVVDKDNAIRFGNIKGEIVYKDVFFSYVKGGKPILKAFDCVIKPGEHVGIVGPSGSGKTTMIKSLLRYFDVDKGAILIDGHDITDVTQESLRESIAIIPQDVTMFHRSIWDNLRMAKEDASDREIIDACKQAKIHDDIQNMPEGYDTLVGERGVKLSGGQRQRVAIARALLKNAPILILDEATSSLDSATEQLIQESINNILQHNSSTVIAIAHRLSTLQNLDKIIVIDQGSIVEQGTHEVLLRKQTGLYKKLWDMQSL